MDMKEVYQLIEKFENSSLLELSLELGDMKLALKKGGATATANEAIKQEWSVGNTETKTEMEEHLQVHSEKVITAPLVGTFYRAPGPDEKPFVEVGQQVKKGDVVAIVEAMKIMNEIVATEDGVVASIEVEDESLVEYGQVLIRLS